MVRSIVLRRFISVPTFRMETKNQSGTVRRILHLAYTKPEKRRAVQLHQPFHLGMWFDVVVVALFLVSAVEYFTA